MPFVVRLIFFSSVPVDKKIKMQKAKLDSIYNKYNRRCFVHPDPIEFLYSYKDIRDREIVGLIASALAYGRVKQILKSVRSVLETMGNSPYRFLKKNDKKKLIRQFKHFRHRFADGKNMVALLYGTRKVIDRFGSLENCFAKGLLNNHENIFLAMSFFSHELTAAHSDPGHLIPDPDKGSACKRMNLFLRWMVRKDRVDPGGWKGISKSKLVVPIDTHIHKIGTMFGFTSRKQANKNTALEITKGFKNISPKDPVKYDFALSRFGIRDDMDLNRLFED